MVVSARPRPPSTLLPLPLVSAVTLALAGIVFWYQIINMKYMYFTKPSWSRLVQCSAPTCLDRCFACWLWAQHVVLYIRSTKRHSHTCCCGEHNGSSAACRMFPLRYARDRSLRLERRSAGDGSLGLKRRSPQPGHGNPRFNRRSHHLRHYSGDGSLRFERRFLQLRYYPGDGSLRFERRSPRSWHKSLRIKRPSPKPRASHYKDSCACASRFSAKVPPSFISQAFSGGRFEVREG